MVEVIPFKPWHLDYMEVRPEITSEEIEITKGRNLSMFYSKFPSLTLMDVNKNTDESHIVACFGGIYLWPHTAESWLRTCSCVDKYKKILIKQIGRLTNFCIDIWNLNRIQTTIQKDWVVARSLAEFLGYVQEAELPCFVGKTTYVLYAQYRSK